MDNSKDDKLELAELANTFLKSKLGENFIMWITQQATANVDKAGDADTADLAMKYVNRAEGLRDAASYLRRLVTDREFIQKNKL